MNITELAKTLNAINGDSPTGFEFDCQPIPGDIEVLQITLSGRDEIPIFLSVTDEQIICISYLWDEAEVKPETRSQMLEAMLDMNIPMPLSSFAKIEDKFVVFGALSIHSQLDDIVHELIVLSDNSLEAIEAMTEYLK